MWNRFFSKKYFLDTEFLYRWIPCNWIGHSRFGKDFASQLERPAAECVTNNFLSAPCRLHPLSFDRPQNRGWRPSLETIVISDDDTVNLHSCAEPPEFAITKVTQPSETEGTASPKSKFDYILKEASRILRVQRCLLLFSASLFVSFTDKYKRRYGPMPLQTPPTGKHNLKYII